MAKLLILDGTSDVGREFTLCAGINVIGRETDCQVQILEGGMSRHHATLGFENGAWHVNDLNSQNGVFVNGRRISSKEKLDGSEELRFGSVKAKLTELNAGPASDGSKVNADEALAKIRSLGNISQRLLAEFSRVIVGQKQVAEELLVAIAAGGHCLMIGLPGLAKTLMVSTLAKILDLNFKRVQFTPDLMPSDIIGTDVLEADADSGRKEFRFIKGPIFTNMLLADEINRTPPKTQAALLEAMQEKQVTASNHVFPLPPPFFVLATQNPLEQEGTYPLPEAQLDRFMFNILVDYPAEAEEEQIIMSTTGHRTENLQKVLGTSELLALQSVVRELPVSPHIVRYATRLVRMTRPQTEGCPDAVKRLVHCGAGPRAAQCLVMGAKARAVLHGRVNVSCEDVRALALPVLRHRIFTNFTADSEGVSVEDIIRTVVSAVPEQNE